MHRKPRAGFTLAEVIVATALSTMIMAGLTSSYMFLVKSAFGMGNYVDMNMQARTALEIFARDVRATRSVTTMTATTYAGTVMKVGGTTASVTWTYSATNKTLTRTAGGARVMMNDVARFQFKYYNTVGNITASTSEAKKVQIDAEMIRYSVAIENTNQVVSARYTMRNRNVSF
jgi:type II secretory pathway pseudopilin PulG